MKLGTVLKNYFVPFVTQEHTKKNKKIEDTFLIKRTKKKQLKNTRNKKKNIKTTNIKTKKNMRIKQKKKK